MMKNPIYQIAWVVLICLIAGISALAAPITQPAADEGARQIRDAGALQDGMTVADKRALKVIGSLKFLKPAASPTGGVERLSPRADESVDTVLPVFSWKPFPGAAKYMLYVAGSPFNSRTLTLTKELSGTTYRFSSADAARALTDGGKYAWVVLARNASGKTISKLVAGDFGTFTVALPRFRAGEITMTRATLNDKSSSSFDRIAVVDRELAPDGILTIAGKLSTTAGVKSVSITADAGASWTQIALSGVEFSHVQKLAEDVDYRFAVRIATETGAMITRNLPGDLEIFRFINLTQRQRIQKLLDTLVQAFLQSDRRLLLSIIDKAWISKEPGYTDYQEFENSIRDEFNRNTTSFCRWSSDNSEVVVPDKRLNVTFTWQRKTNFTTFSEARDFNATARLDIRKIDGQWMIHEDLDRKIFFKDFGLIPAPPD